MTRFNDQRAALEEGLADDNALYADRHRNQEINALGIGRYWIAPVGDGTKVYIKDCDTGEGMAIAATEVEAAIERLWRERF